MAVKLIASYSKKCGLPGYSSVQYSVSVESELTTIDDVAAESARLYSLLQENVDSHIQNHGFVPPDGYGMAPAQPRQNGNGQNGSGQTGNGTASNNDAWACSEGQKKFILQLVHDHQLDKNDIETLANDLFGAGVRSLDKLQASGLIDELLEKVGKKRTQRRPRWQNRERARS